MPYPQIYDFDNKQNQRIFNEIIQSLEDRIRKLEELIRMLTEGK